MSKNRINVSSSSAFQVIESKLVISRFSKVQGGTQNKPLPNYHLNYRFLCRRLNG